MFVLRLLLVCVGIVHIRSDDATCSQDHCTDGGFIPGFKCCVGCPGRGDVATCETGYTVKWVCTDCCALFSCGDTFTCCKETTTSTLLPTTTTTTTTERTLTTSTTTTTTTSIKTTTTSTTSTATSTSTTTSGSTTTTATAIATSKVLFATESMA
eukprot:gene28357-23704_t